MYWIVAWCKIYQNSSLRWIWYRFCPILDNNPPPHWCLCNRQDFFKDLFISVYVFKKTGTMQLSFLVIVALATQICAFPVEETNSKRISKLLKAYINQLMLFSVNRIACEYLKLPCGNMFHRYFGNFYSKQIILE